MSAAHAETHGAPDTHEAPAGTTDAHGASAEHGEHKGATHGHESAEKVVWYKSIANIIKGVGKQIADVLKGLGNTIGNGIESLLKVAANLFDSSGSNDGAHGAHAPAH